MHILVVLSVIECNTNVIWCKGIHMNIYAYQRSLNIHICILASLVVVRKLVLKKNLTLCLILKSVLN